MNYFYAPQLKDGADFLNEEESAHCVRVLRHKEGDTIGLLDGKGGKYTASIRQANPNKTSLNILDKIIIPTPSYKIHLAITPTKNADRMEWLVEKLTEIGVDQISLFFSQNSERRKYRTDRLEKKIIGALKQSKNPFLPQLNEPVVYNDLLTRVADDERFIAYVELEERLTLFNLAKKNKSTTILIGPEGDFTSEEVQQAEKTGFQRVSLGRNILRTETAGLLACHAIHLINS